MSRKHLLASVLTVALGALAVTFAAAPPPPEDQPVPEQNQAMVRFLHAAPNAEVERIVLTGGDENVEPQEFSNLSYGEMSDYVAVPASGYDVTVSLAGVPAETAEGDAAAGVPTQSLDTFAGEYYTIALVGLVPPGEEATENEGFFDWLSGLFSNDDDAFAFRTLVINDGVTNTLNQDEAEVRLVHLSPGTDELSLVAVRGGEEDADVLHTVAYGDVSGFANLVPAEATGLEIRAAGSEAVLFDLSDANLSTGRSHTVYVIGTPVESAPLDVIVVANPQVAAGVAGTAAVPPGSATFDATQVTWMRDSLIALEERLMAIEDHLANIEGVEGAQEEVAAAQQEVDEAMELLMAAREQIESQPAVGTPAAEPAGEDADGN